MRTPLRHLVFALLPLAAAACGGPVPRSWPLFDRVKTATGEHAMVVSVSPIASRVGLEILARGGNAVDAAVAIGFALEVVHPAAGNIGGGGFMVMRFASGDVAAIDYRETAPGRATPDMYLDSAGNVMETSVTGALSAGVPGSVAGMAEAQRRYGKLPFAEVVAPAARLARDGFVLPPQPSDWHGFRPPPRSSCRAARLPTPERRWCRRTSHARSRRSPTADRACSIRATWPTSS
jgi:gamma-glutamyltranspeptidase/glutathione hydrolase